MGICCCRILCQHYSPFSATFFLVRCLWKIYDNSVVAVCNNPILIRCKLIPSLKFSLRPPSLCIIAYMLEWRASIVCDIIFVVSRLVIAVENAFFSTSRKYLATAHEDSYIYLNTLKMACARNLKA